MTACHPALKQLQYLVSLHEHGHFGRATAASFVSQSTLSAGLRDLEGLLGVTLVERTKRAVRITALSNVVVAKAHREIALVWRKNSPRADEFRLLEEELRTG